MITADPTLTITAAEVDQEHLKRLARCLKDSEHSYRKHHDANAVEVWAESSNAWVLLTFQTRGGVGVHYFATTQDRDHAYNALRALT